MSVPSSKSGPKRTGKCTVARAMFGGAIRNGVVRLPENKEETQFLVTLKNVPEKKDEHNEQSPPDSRGVCRCDGKNAKAQNKLVITAKDGMKAKTKLNALRLFANSGFVFFDDQIQHNTDQATTRPDHQQATTRPDHHQAITEPPSVKKNYNKHPKVRVLYVNKKMQIPGHKQHNDHTISDESENNENGGQDIRGDSEHLDDPKRNQDTESGDEDPRLTGGNDNKLPYQQCDCPCSRQTEKKTGKKLKPYYLCSCCLPLKKSQKKDVVKSSETPTVVQEPSSLPEERTESPVSPKTSVSPAPLIEPPEPPPVPPEPPKPPPPVIPFCDEKTCPCRSHKPPVDEATQLARRRLARAEIFKPLDSADGLEDYNRQLAHDKHKNYHRLGNLEKQMDLLRLELGSIRNQRVSNDEARRYSQLDVRLQELNLIINDLKDCCQQGKDTSGNSSGETEFEKFERQQYYSQVSTPLRHQQPLDTGMPTQIQQAEQLYENRKCECSCDSDLCGKKKLAMCFFGKTKKCPYGDCRCGLGPVPPLILRSRPELVRRPQVQKSSSHDFVVVERVPSPITKTKPEPELVPRPQLEKSTSHDFVVVERVPSPITKTKPEPEIIPCQQQEKSSSKPFIEVAPPLECPCGGNMNAKEQKTEGAQCICDACRCAVHPQPDVRIPQASTTRQEPIDITTRLTQTTPDDTSSNESSSKKKYSIQNGAFAKFRCCSHSQRGESFDGQEPKMNYIETNRFSSDNSTGKVVLSRKECSCAVKEMEIAAETSYCHYCNDSAVPLVKKNLVREVLYRVADHDIREIALILLLQEDGLYHISLAESQTGRPITCLYATEQAVRSANEDKLFERIHTFFIMDARSSLNKRHKILSQTFEFSTGGS